MSVTPYFDSSVSVYRYAGFFYLIIIVMGISSEVLVRSNLTVAGDASLTASNIIANQALFRGGFIADVIMLFCDVAVAVLLYLLLKPVNSSLALIAAVFRLTQAIILSVNLLVYYSAILILKDGEIGNVFSTDQVEAIALYSLLLHSYGYDLGLLFFGVSNILLGYLIIKSSVVPGALGIGLISAAAVYLIGSFARFLSPESYGLMQPAYVIPVVAELSFCCWLLWKGFGTYS